mgnify:CR=1 FL=1
MGMAASQARYLALVARKSNCEYEGQQINQARTVLSNQSANLFNQMLGLKVPVPPSTSDFTKNIYTYKDGLGKETKLENWQQLSYSDPDYNYVVTRSYTTKRYTGAIKKMNDPQVQFTDGVSSKADIEAAENAVRAANEAYQAALKAQEDAKANLDDIQTQINAIKADAAKLANYATEQTGITSCTYDDGDATTKKDEYSVTDTSGTKTYKAYLTFDETQKAEIKTALADFIKSGAISEAELAGLYFDYNGTTYTFAKGTELNSLALASGTAEAGTFDGKLNIYEKGNVDATLLGYNTQISALTPLLNLAQSGYEAAQASVDTAKTEYDEALKAYNELKHPTYIGNCDLVPLAELNKDQLAELQQVVADMKEQGIESKILDCFEYDEAGNITSYKGGVYSFKMNGVMYYTSYADLEASYNSGTGPNNIDGQTKLPYYNASYIDTKIEETEKALVETDGNGRFTSIRFEDDSIVYTLNMGTETDDVAYQDAMNQYYYDNAVYDKMIRDINAKTSIIQQEDQQLELRLKQLDTEQSALSTEMEAVKKVVDDNVESSFKTFGG